MGWDTAYYREVLVNGKNMQRGVDVSYWELPENGGHVEKERGCRECRKRPENGRTGARGGSIGT